MINEWEGRFNNLVGLIGLSINRQFDATPIKRFIEENFTPKSEVGVQPEVSLPCPFCANTKIRTWQTEDEYWHIQCDSDVCGASMNDFTTEQEAIKQWNVRSN